jgi:predicted O-methyltransferase YrrM
MNRIKEVRDQVYKMSQDKEKWQNPIGQETAKLLCNLINELNAKKVLEIGTSAGYSGLWIIEALLKTDGHLFTIESNKERYATNTKNFEKAEVTHMVTNVLGHAPEDLPAIPKGIDFAFFDATKRETISFLEGTWEKLNPGAKILVDNVDSHIDKMQEFIDYLDEHNYQYKRIHIDAGLILIDKPS